MSLFDTIGEKLGRGSGTQVGALSEAVKALLGGGNAAGMGDLVKRFERAGFGEIIGSWIGTGANKPISPQDLHQALGDDKVQQASAQTGVSAAQLLPLLAQFLPGIIDRLTPGGSLPQRQVDDKELAQASQAQASQNDG